MGRVESSAMGVLQAAGSKAKPAQHACSLLPWKACSREGLSLLHPQPGSNFPACVPSPDKSSHLEGVEVAPQRRSAQVLWAVSRGGRLPGSAQTPRVPRSSDGQGHTLVSSAKSSRRRRPPGAGLGDKFNSGPGWLCKAMWWVGPSQTSVSNSIRNVGAVFILNSFYP